MDNRESAILNFLADEAYVPMKAKEMAFVLGVEKERYSEFREILEKLVSDYKVQCTKKGKYMLIDNNLYKTGEIRLNAKGFGFVKLENSDEEIFVSEKNINNALNGDLVIVQLFEEYIDSKLNVQNKNSNEHAEGKVVKVLKHEKNKIVGTFKNSKNFGFVIPDDRNFGTDIFISKNNFLGAKNNQKVVVKIVKFAEKGKKAEGKIIEVLGNIDEAGVDMLSLVKEYDLPYEFPEPVINEAKSLKLVITEEDLKYRLDLRNEEIFTIDGEDAKDLDDGVCVKKLENGNYELGVHIADVSHYVKSNSNLDKEAIIRGTSVYMMDRVIPMLPTELSNGICSLNAGEERFAISVIMEINNKGQVISSDVRKSVIKVTKRMTYNNVFKILSYINIQEENSQVKNNTRKNENQIDYLNLSEISKEDIQKLNEEYGQYFTNFMLMEELAIILKNKRKKDGSLDLDVPESKITLNENGVAINVEKYEITFANEIIEQFMLIANETIAEKFYWLEAPFIYRVHPVPDMDKVNELNKFLWNLGYKIKANKESIHPKAFAEVLEQVKGKPEERVVSNLILRTLKIAQYESENHGHFGIASKYYCHFTSPIRRYPDLFIHRVISKYLEKNYNLPEKEIEILKEQSEKYSKTSSEREKVAQKVERDADDIKKAEFMQGKIGEEYEGIISNITSFGVFVELENTVEGLVRFENLGDEYFEYDEEHKRLVGEVTKTVFNIGEKMKIKVIEASKETRRISFARISRGQLGTCTD